MLEHSWPWEDFDRLHVIRRLRQLIGQWWNIQLNFTDDKGFLRGVPHGKFFNPLNSLCQFVTKNDRTFRACMGTVRKTTLDGSTLKQSKLGLCHAGFSTLVVPIRVGNRYLGCVFGDGFLVQETAVEQRMQITNFLRASYGEGHESIKWVETLPVLSEQEVNYLRELIEMVVDEILTTQSNLSQAKEEVEQLKSELGTRFSFGMMTGKSKEMQNLYSMIEKVCDSQALVLIRGENGTGKELIARALHYNSKRKKSKFLVVNCGAFNENLLESELFGHIKGSFTGAMKDKIGLFEAATNGTLFLDEIGDTSMSMQVKLLRILQEGTFTPVGSTDVKQSNARIVCATNKDLEEMVKQGLFREDLYYRLNVINVAVPPLRDRKEDIPLLVESFLNRYAASTKTPEKKPSQACMNVLMNYNWPGNVRELENEIERLCVLSGKEKTLEESYLSQRIQDGLNADSSFRVQGRLKDALEDLEKKMILDGLKRTKWNKSKLAKELGISRAGLIMKVEKYQLEKRG